jgi:hypothetical protein
MENFPFRGLSLLHPQEHGVEEYIIIVQYTDKIISENLKLV